jgi:hypothetical protein
MAIKIKTYSFDYTLIDVELSCELQYERGFPATSIDPPEPAYSILDSACVGDVNIIEILSDEQKAEIETAFCEQHDESDWNDAGDYRRDCKRDEAAERHWHNMNEMAKRICGVQI